MLALRHEYVYMNAIILYAPIFAVLSNSGGNGGKMKKNSASIYIVAFVFFAAALGYLCFTGFSDNNVYFLNVSEARAASPDKLRQARLFGLVSADNMDKKINSLSFQLVDKDSAAHTIHVLYTGMVPDTFKAGAEVIVEGSMNPDGKFSAKTLMTKCPSKYKKENRQI